MPLQSDKLRLLRRIPDIRFEDEPRGYSKDQVDRVLANLAPLADEIERLQARLSEAETRAASAEARLVEARGPSQTGSAGPAPAPQPDFDETLRNTLVSAQRQADTTIREAQEEAERLRTEAEFQTNALLADARDQSAEMTTEAVAYRERLMAEAATDRAKLLEEAKEEAAKKVAAVEKELVEAHDTERMRLVGEVNGLQDQHKALSSDVKKFEAYIESRSQDIREALADITGVLDDPERLKNDNEFEVAEIDEFDSEDYPPVAVEVVALNELETEADMAFEATTRPGDAIDAADLDDLVDESKADSGHDPVAADQQAADPSTPDADGKDHPMADGFIADPQLGVDTQTVPNPVHVADEGHETAPPPPGTNGKTDSNGSGDPFLNELKRVTSDEQSSGDAISDFLDDNEHDDRGGGGWFGRRR